MHLFKPSNLHAFFHEHGIKPKKSLSQNFLIDGNIIKKFISTLNLQDNDIVLEIGAGAGAITQVLLENNIKVIAIEKDKKLAENLKKFNKENLIVYHDDFLSFDLNLLPKTKKIKVITNIPFHITSPIIIKLLKHHPLFSKISILLQKEMAQRILSKKNSKDYSSFTIFINCYSDPKFISKVSKNSFYPIPNVDISMIELTINNKITLEDPNLFHNFVRKAFEKRRKKLTTSLKENIDVDKLSKILLDLKLSLNNRPENFSFFEFLQIFKKL